MLLELSISNFALIDHQRIEFAPGLNVLSGETGAGKSIVLHALELLLGGKPRGFSVRAGAESAEVEALFSLDSLSEEARAALPEIAQGDELVLSRTVSTTGRGKILINGKLGTVALLEEIVARVVTICGQNSHMRLLNPESHLKLLDGYRGGDDEVKRYRALYQEMVEQEKLLAARKEALQRAALRQAELQFIVEELTAKTITEGGRQKLEDEIRAFSQGETILDVCGRGTELLVDEGGIFTLMSRLQGIAHEVKRIHSSSGEAIAAAVTLAEGHLEDAERELKKLAAGVSLDSERIDSLRDELAEIARLERKYRCNEAGLVALLATAQGELSSLEQGGEISALEESVARLREEAASLAKKISSKRRESAKTLARAVERELKALAMGAASLVVSVTDRATLGADGGDVVEFLIATNKGEEAKPLRQIASGGELSRIMLVMMQLLRERSGVNVLVFDEVDTGISGAVARAVGEKLLALSHGAQVLCITHLPQVASLADHHILVEKREVSQGGAVRTKSSLRVLTNDERIDEVARMLSGKEVTERGRQTARELMERQT
jgi:DNA repair protein RecN (Recombination protein N)